MDTMNSTNGTNTDSVSGGSFNGLFFKLLVFLLSSSAFWVAISLAVLIHFILAYVFRPRKNESSPEFCPEMENLCDKDRFTGLDYIWEHNHETIWNSSPENYWINDPQYPDELSNVNLIHGKISDCSEDSEKLTSSFSFKFDHQTVQELCEAKVHSVKKEESPAFNELHISDKPPSSNESPISASIQKYQVLPERNLRGFVQQPETMTISVNKLSTELIVEKLASKEERLNINLEERKLGETEKLGRVMEPEPKFDIIQKPKQTKVHMALDGESLSELKQEYELAQDVKGEPGPEQVPEKEQEPEAEPEPEPEAEHQPVDGIRCDTEDKYESDLSDGSGRESCSKSNPVYTNYEETKQCTEIPLAVSKRLCNKTASVPNRRKLARRKRSIQQERLLEKPKLSSSSSLSTISSERGGRLLTRRYVSKEFSDFDSDSQSSISDGYSVKDLVVDSDSDWFLSERESDNSPHKTYSTVDSINLVRYGSKLIDHLKEIEKNQAQSFYGETDSSNSPVQISSNHHQPDEVNTWLDNNSKPEFDMQYQEEEAGTEPPNESVGSIFRDEGLKETNIESNRSLGKIVIPNKDLNKESQTVSLSQEDEATFEHLDREISTETLDQYETISPRKDYATFEHLHSEIPKEALDQCETISPRKDNANEKSTQDTGKTDREQSMSKDKGKEYLEEEEEDELESLWEHQDLIEQLKMEIKKARAVGLPTILEESETPKTTIEELKAWHFDEKFLREAPMDELNKFYKSYRERMRKFDILNYQKMYAVGFLQLKDPLESMGSQKPLLPTITSLLSQNLHRHRKSTNDPSKRFIKELRCDLEMIYVAQMCLSWEFLRWQYEKACEMPESDPYHSHRYNQAAGEFQQFQVLVNRFVENEPFQGPRLPNYVKNRCVLRNLLQVPVIKEDNPKDKYEDDRKGNHIITSEDLEDIMVESIRVFWEFVKADKNEMPVILKGLVVPQVELQDPSDYDFMMRLNSTLQKKEKRLKDLLKTGNCLVKKFKKAKEDRSNEDLFFSQVDIKLVSRVLKMPKISSEQLQWCDKKLDKITFVNRKIQREPAFLLFPC